MLRVRPDLRPGRVAVLRALKLGDMLCAVPALRALRAAWPESEIVLVGLPWAAALAERFDHLIDGFRALPGFPGLPEAEPEIGRIPAFLAEVQRERFDLAIQLHGSGERTNPLTALLGARRCAGFFRPGSYCPDPGLFLPWPERGLEVRRLLRLAEFLGAPDRGEHLEFPLRPADDLALASVVGPEPLRPGGYACLHPGASVPERRWPVDRFARLARELAGSGLRVVITGTAEESALARSIAREVPGGCLDLTGRTDLGPLAALLNGARLLVCNDTGVSHLAAALRVPSVVISTGDNPERWAPADARRHRVLCDGRGVEVAEALAAVRMLPGRDETVAFVDSNPVDSRDGSCVARGS